MRGLFTTGSKVVDGTFSLSSEPYTAKNGSLANDGGDAGVVGVIGISSDMSDTEVDVLIGVLTLEADVRLGVTGRMANAS